MSISFEHNKLDWGRKRFAPKIHRMEVSNHEILTNHDLELVPIGTLSPKNSVRSVTASYSVFRDNISDSTSRDLGLFVVINQLANESREIRLLNIEGLETPLHPAASGALMDAFREAATQTRVLVTTHGANLPARFDPNEGDHLLLATMSEGTTYLSEIDPACKRIKSERLNTAANSLRIDQLEPDLTKLGRQNASIPTCVGNGDSRAMARL